MKSTGTKSSSDGTYTLNGEKLWITNGNEADIFLIFVNVNRELGYKGITCFLVDKETDILGGQLIIGKKENKLGIRASSTCPVIFQDLKASQKRCLCLCDCDFQLLLYRCIFRSDINFF